MAEPLYSIGLTARVLPVSNAVNVGDALVYSTSQGLWVTATAANRTAADSRAAAIALTVRGGSAIGTATYQASGPLATEVSGLGPTTMGTYQLVRVSSAGRLERIATYTGGDDVVGYAFPDGRVALHIGLPWDAIAALAGGGGGTAAGSPGDIQVHAATGTGFDKAGYWKAVDYAGKLRATYWDPVDGVTVRSVLEVSAGANTGASEVLPTTGFIRISDSIGNAFPIITRRRSGSDQLIISSSGGAVQFGDDSAVTTTDLRGYQVFVASGAGGLYLSAAGGTIFANDPFVAYDARLWVFRGHDSGTLNTSGLSLGSSTIATSGGTTTLTSTQAASLSLVFTGTGGTINAPDRTRNVYFIDASAASGAIVIQDGAATGVTVAAGKTDIVFHDGTNYRSALTNFTAGGTPGGASGQLQTNNGSGGFAGPGPYAAAGYISMISGTPTTNGIRLANNQNLSSRNAAGTADLQLCTLSGSNQFIIGGNSTGTVTSILLGLGSVFWQFIESTKEIATSAAKSTQTAVSATDTITDTAQLTTTTSSATDIYTFTLANNAVTTIDIRITACKNDSSAGDVWRGRATFRNAAGTVSTVAAANITKDGSTSWAVTISNSGTTAKVTVTGAASNTIQWGLNINYQVTRQS